MTDLHIRITCDKATKDSLASLITEMCDRYIICEEHAEHRHFHIYMRYLYQDAPRWDKLRYALKKEGYFGKGKLSISQRRTSNLESYVVKEGDYIYKGFTPEEITEFAENAYEKPKSYKVQKTEIADAFQKGEITKEQFVTSLIMLMCEFNVEYYRHKLVAYVKTQQMKKHPRYMDTEIMHVLQQI